MRIRDRVTVRFPTPTPTPSQGPDCDCDGFLAVVNIFLPVVNVLPLVAIVYLIGSTLTDLHAALPLTLAPKPNPSPNPNPAP